MNRSNLAFFFRNYLNIFFGQFFILHVRFFFNAADKFHFILKQKKLFDEKILIEINTFDYKFNLNSYISVQLENKDTKITFLVHEACLPEQK